MPIDKHKALEDALRNARKYIASLPMAEYPELTSSGAVAIEAAQRRVLAALPSDEDREALALFMVGNSCFIMKRLKDLGVEQCWPQHVRFAGESEEDAQARQLPRVVFETKEGL